MKSYEDIAERVFEKGDEILKRRQKRTALIRKTSLIVSEMCAVVLICFSVWKTGGMQVLMNRDFPDTLITESKSTDDFSVPVSTLENNDDNVIYASETAAVSEPNVDLAIFPTESALENIAMNTSDPDNVSASQLQTLGNPAETQCQQTICTTLQMQTSLQTVLNTTGIPKPIQTTVCTTVQTENEGSYYMKKLASFLTSAIVIAASATPVIGNAEYHLDETRFYKGERAIFAKMDSGEFDLDINGDGVFDVFDGYTMTLYFDNWVDPDYVFPNAEMEEEAYEAIYKAVDRETRDRIEAIADYDGDGEVTRGDRRLLLRYFIISGRLKREYLDPSYYFEKSPSDSHEYTGWTSEELYAFNLIHNMEALLAGYDIVAEMYENGTIDLDFNGNGQLDIGDVYDIYVYEDCRRFDTLKYKRVKPDYIPGEDWDRCDEAYEMYPHDVSGWWDAGTGVTSRYNFSYYVTLYIVGHIELKYEYCTEDYYKETFSPYFWAQSYRIGDRVKDAAAYLGLTPDENAWLKYDRDTFYDLFDAYCNDVESGLRPAPDVNMDGVVDLNDYFVINTYFSELIEDKTVDNSILPTEIWDNINENFDINGNGTAKDIYDVMSVQMYVIKYTDTSDFDEAYDRYKASCGDNSTLEIESQNYKRKAKTLEELENKIVYGDVNCDGNVDIADATMILQHIANGDKYKLSAEQAANADCYNPGSGITAMDALAIEQLDAMYIKSLPVVE